MGITVQILDKGLDCGIPVVEKKIKIKRKESLKTLTNRAYAASTDLMYDALKKLSHPDYQGKYLDSLGKVYTLPNLRQWICLHLKVLYRKVF